MAYLDPLKQTRKENYKMLSESVVPRPIAFVSSQNKEGVLNAAPFSFFNVITAQPPLVSICVGRRDGEVVKDTGKNILETKEFVIHIVDDSFINEVNQSSAEYPSHVSEVNKTGLSTIDSKRVAVPGIKEAKIRLECELYKTMPIGDDEEYTTDLLIGKVIYAYIDDEIYDEGRINAKKLGPIGRLAGADYSKLGEIFSIQRPK